MKSAIYKKDNYLLQDEENYKTEENVDIGKITQKYSELIIEYFKFIVENIKIKKYSLLKFIILRGLDTITNVFFHILYFTKNIDLTYYHSQKSYYFYVEFVGQISDEDKMFLQLSSRDATIYVYKKSIFEIKKLNENVSEEFKKKLDIIKSYINLYQTYLIKIIQSEKVDLTYVINLTKLTEKLNKLTKKTNIIILENITDKLYNKIDNVNMFFEINHLLIKKIIKNQESIKNIEKKINLDEFNDKLLEPFDKFINWFL